MNTTPSGQVVVVDPGLGVSIQDGGRIGYRSIGVPLSGALDPPLMAMANLLLDNQEDAATLEICLQGPTLRAENAPISVAITGAISAQITTQQGKKHSLPSGQSTKLLPGESIRLSAAESGVAYLALSGGIHTAPMLSSRSQLARAALGGVNGRALMVNDILPVGAAEKCWSAPDNGLLPESNHIRVLLGPQDDYFSEQSLNQFFNSGYEVTTQKDRMGMRLAGATLQHNQRGGDIISDGVVPGSIQVPANGQPIILLADCQTSGGYPKIATVIRADLPLLAHCSPGTKLYFKAVDHATAKKALLETRQRLDKWQKQRKPSVSLSDNNWEELAAGLGAGSAIRGDEEQLSRTDDTVYAAAINACVAATWPGASISRISRIDK